MTTEQEPLIVINNAAPPLSTLESPVPKKPFLKTKKFLFMMSRIVVITAIADYFICKYMGVPYHVPQLLFGMYCPGCGMG